MHNTKEGDDGGVMVAYITWKRLRNFLNKMEMVDSLEAIWYYSWYTFPLAPLPNGLKTPVDMDVCPKVLDPNGHYLLTWELSSLAAEVVLNANECMRLPRRSLKSQKDFISALNKLKKLNEDTTAIILKNNSAFDELYRIEHQQLKYQGHIRDLVPVVRYFKIYNNPEMEKIFMSRLGISCVELFAAGLVLRGLFMQSARVDYPIEIDDVSPELAEKVNAVVGMLSVDMEEVREMIRQNHTVDENYQYTFNPLIAKPLIIFRERELVCPIPDNLTKRLLDGIYYDLCDDGRFKDGHNFGNALGESFQNYVGDLLRATLGGDCIFSEDTDMKNESLKRCDWVIDQNDSCVLVECKTKRPAQIAYTVIDDLECLKAQLNILAEAVVQSYETYFNYKNGEYKSPQYIFKDEVKTAICVVTMEPWYLIGKQKQELDRIVKNKLNRFGDPVVLTQEVPYMVMSIEEFELFSYYLTKYNGFELIHEYFAKVSEDAVSSVANFIEDKDFLGKYQYAFEDDLEACYGREIAEILEESRRRRRFS